MKTSSPRKSTTQTSKKDIWTCPPRTQQQTKCFCRKNEQKLDSFPIKGSIKIIANDVLMASLIGTSVLMISETKKLFYSVNNDYKQIGKVDFFSEFVEWEIESHDQIITIGKRHIYSLWQKRNKKVQWYICFTIRKHCLTS